MRKSLEELDEELDRVSPDRFYKLIDIIRKLIEHVDRALPLEVEQD